MYTALYRKLRPTTFGDMVGQEHIKRTLINQITTGRITHAYLFCGTRGTGKTSCARVFARVVNCEAHVNGEACGVCRSCVEIEGGTGLDVVEIDAASNNGVDNIRDLREEVQYPPNGRYRVYIIDEVHMLSGGAFNALLKTLEEPPPHVIFILATTDPQKIPPTIHSRLMRFDFHRPTAAQMVAALARYMAEEGITVGADALEYVARISDGSWRDALSLLDRCASLYHGEEITRDKVLEITGSVDAAVFFDVIDALKSKDAQKCLQIIEDLHNQGRDFAQFAEEMLYHLRNQLIAAASEVNADRHEIIRLITTFSQLTRSMRNSAQGRLMLEVACIDFIAGPAPVFAPVAQPQAQVSAPNSAEIAKKPPKIEEKPPEIKKKAVPDDIRKVLLDWRNFAADTQKDCPFIEGTQAGFLEDEYLYIVCPNIIMESHLRKHQEFLQDRLQERYNLEFNLNIIAQNFYDDRHRRKYNLTDDFNYAGGGEVQSLKNQLQKIIDFEIEEI